MFNIRKRDRKEVPYDSNRIIVAIEKAMNSATGIFVEGQAKEIESKISSILAEDEEKRDISSIEKLVFDLLIEKGNTATARAYETYRSVQAFKRAQNTTDLSIMELITNENDEVQDENSNKNPTIASTQRDLIAGEVSKDIAKRKMLPIDIVEAHDSGAIHIHDMDYLIQPIFNCCLVNLKDMLDNGTVVNGKMVESPKSFQVACTVMTQIIAQIASNQYGGQTIDIGCLGKYLRRSYDRNLNLAMEELGDVELATKLADKLTKRDLASGIQTIQYQINTLNPIGAF